MEGSRATLSCTLTGISIEQLENLKWIKNSNVLSDAKLTNNAFQQDRLNLELYSLSYSKDNGVYQCEIRLTNGQILVSNKLDLKVEFAPQIRLESESNYFDVMQGNRFNVSCLSTGYPIPDIKFSKNGKKIKNIKEFYDYENFRKTIYLNIEKSNFYLHNGTYSCYFNKMLKKNFDLFIKFGPLFVNKTAEIHVNESDDVLIECTMSKHPIPRLKWKGKNSQRQLNYELKYSNQTFSTSVLNIKNVSRYDMDEYFCFDEENSHISKKYSLFVHCKKF